MRNKNNKNEKKSYAVFGLGEFGRSVALELMSSGADVMALDIDEYKVSELADKVTLALQIDAAEERSFKKLGLSNMDGVIVAMTGCLDACLMTILKAKEEGVPFVLAKSQNETQTTIFEKIGADKIIIPEHDGGVRAARNIIAGNFLDFVELSERIRMIEIPVKKEWIGKNLRELSLRQKYKINVIAIRRENELTTDINPDTAFNGKETMLVTVDKKDIENLMK